MAEMINYTERRQRFMSTFANNPVLTETLPKLAMKLFFGEFGVSLDDPTIIPIVWSCTMEKLMQFLHSQNADQFSAHIPGFSVEYLTERSESDKSRNIVPEVYHEYVPVFVERKHDIVPGSNYNQTLIAKYNDWRTVNLTETNDMVEREAYMAVLEKYGANLMVSATIFPLMAAIYCAGVTIAQNTGTPVNMYNWFTITCRGDDMKIILTPLASIKQGLKDDNKRG